jgi:DNA-binding GntR family transcriptional regulator
MRKPSQSNFDLKQPQGLFKERTSLGEDVFYYLRDALIDQTIPPGSRLVESRIAEQLGISRTPVREAIHKLEREDWIKKLPAGGYQAMGLTAEDIEETFGIRSVLEAYAARLAAEKHAPSDLLLLSGKIEAYQACLDRSSQSRLNGSNIDELFRLNTEFHDLLYEMSRSPKLIRMINGLRAQIFRFRRMILKQAAMARQSNDDHRKMLEAIEKRDGDEVESLVREHILKGKTAVLSSLPISQANTEAAF